MMMPLMPYILFLGRRLTETEREIEGASPHSFFVYIHIYFCFL